MLDLNGKSILITGGTGIIGSALSKLLLNKGYQVSILSRSNKNIANIKTYLWDVKNHSLDENAIKNASSSQSSQLKVSGKYLMKVDTTRYKKKKGDSEYLSV